jgi:hypothetical protein
MVLPVHHCLQIFPVKTVALPGVHYDFPLFANTIEELEAEGYDRKFCTVIKIAAARTMKM